MDLILSATLFETRERIHVPVRVRLSFIEKIEISSKVAFFNAGRNTLKRTSHLTGNSWELFSNNFHQNWLRIRKEINKLPNFDEKMSFEKLHFFKQMRVALGPVHEFALISRKGWR